MTATNQHANRASGDTQTGARVLRTLIREPLVHFLLFALLFVTAYQLFDQDGPSAPDTIVVTGERIAQLSLMYQSSRQRPPTDAELKDMIDDFVKEEIYYREARKLGLDTDDTVIRRRLRQKLEFLTDAAAEQLVPSEQELRTFFDANAARFAEEARFALEQIYINPRLRGAAAPRDAASLLEQLRSNPPADIAELGDSTSLPSQLPVTGRSELVSIFGEPLVAAAEAVTPDVWAGPFSSDYGLHLVRTSGHVSGQVPPFDSVRDAVKVEWTYVKRRELEAAKFQDYLKSYDVRIEVGGSPPVP